MSYISLRDKSRYLKDMQLSGKNKALREDEITSCEEYADALIEGMLGKSWSTDNVPKLVEHIADLLGSAKAYTMLLCGQQPQESEYAEILRKEAIELMDKIINGEIGLKLPDGSWDSDLPGKNKEDSLSDSLEILL